MPGRAWAPKTPPWTAGWSLGVSGFPGGQVSAPGPLQTGNAVRLTRFSKALAACAVVVLLPTGVAAASPSQSRATPPVARASAAYGAGWLASQLSANGGYLTGFGVPDQTDTAYAVIGLHAAGYGRAAAEQAIGYLETQLTDALTGPDGQDAPGALGYYVMAAVSAGRDPYHFGGRTPANNLVARLLATQQPNGLFGTSDPTYDGTFRQGVALAALKAAGVHNAAVLKGLAWLAGQQCANGLFVSYRVSTSTPCPAADPNTFAGPDTNSSSLALQGLAAYGLTPRRAQALASLHTIQSSDGGFPFLAAAGQSSDPNSTALSIQAILALDDNPAARSWQVAGATPYAALASFQLGCGAPATDRGAFFYPGSSDPNVLATVQAVPAAAGATLPVKPGPISSAVPVQNCGSVRNSVAHKGNSAALADRQALTLAAKSPLVGTAGACSGTTGVTVTVDFVAFGGVQQTRCAAGAQTSGVTALQNAGFTPAGTSKYGLAFVCRINNLPSSTAQACVNTPPATAYWAYYHALAGATTWAYSSSGASSYVPPQGSIDAWAFGNGATPTKTPAQVRASTS